MTTSIVVMYLVWMRSKLLKKLFLICWSYFVRIKNLHSSYMVLYRVQPTWRHSSWVHIQKLSPLKLSESPSTTTTVPLVNSSSKNFEVFDINTKTFGAKRDTNNPYDDKGSHLWWTRSNWDIFWKVNETVAPWMDDGFDLLIEVVNVTGGEGSLGTQYLGRKKKKSLTHWTLNPYLRRCGCTAQ